MSSEDRVSVLAELISGLDEDSFLVGPDRDPSDLDVDDIFISQWSVAIRDLPWDLSIVGKMSAQNWFSGLCDAAMAGDVDVLFEENGIRYLPAIDPTRTFVAGVVAWDPDQPDPMVGLYTGVTLIVRDDMRGRGIGKRLVMERFLLDGVNPVWALDDPSYSYGGEAAHRAAYVALCRECEKTLEVEPE